MVCKRECQVVKSVSLIQSADTASLSYSVATKIAVNNTLYYTRGLLEIYFEIDRSSRERKGIFKSCVCSLKDDGCAYHKN